MQNSSYERTAYDRGYRGNEYDNPFLHEGKMIGAFFSLMLISKFNSSYFNYHGCTEDVYARRCKSS